MDNVELKQRLIEGSALLGVGLSEDAATALMKLSAELLKWNAKVNLTSITEPEEIVEKHFIDSLACVPFLGPGATMLDLGAGAGFPGLPVKLARPELQVTLVDAVAKKVTFIKHAAVALRLSGVRAVHARATGRPEAEGLPKADLLVSRALMDVPEWLKLAAPYLAAGGRVVAMTGRRPEAPDRAAQFAGLRVHELRRYELPFTRAERHVLVAGA